MFVHFGLYALLGRQEWVMANENIPPEEYEKLADRFQPKPGAPRVFILHQPPKEDAGPRNEKKPASALLRRLRASLVLFNGRGYVLSARAEDFLEEINESQENGDDASPDIRSLRLRVLRRAGVFRRGGGLYLHI